MKKWENLYIFFQLVKVLGFMVCLFTSCSFPFQNVNNFVEITDIEVLQLLLSQPN